MQNSDSTGDFYTVSDIARHLGLGEQRIYQLAALGVIPTVRLTPRRIRIPKAAFEHWLEQQKEKALAEVR